MISEKSITWPSSCSTTTSRLNAPSPSSAAVLSTTRKPPAPAGSRPRPRPPGSASPPCAVLISTRPSTSPISVCASGRAWAIAARIHARSLRGDARRDAQPGRPDLRRDLAVRRTEARDLGGVACCCERTGRAGDQRHGDTDPDEKSRTAPSMPAQTSARRAARLSRGSVAAGILTRHCRECSNTRRAARRRRPRARPRLGRAVWLLLLAALVLRLGFVAVTPDYQLVDDATDYDRHARSIAAATATRTSACPAASRRSGRPATPTSSAPCTAHRRQGRAGEDRPRSRADLQRAAGDARGGADRRDRRAAVGAHDRAGGDGRRRRLRYR